MQAAMRALAACILAASAGMVEGWPDGLDRLDGVAWQPIRSRALKSQPQVW